MSTTATQQDLEYRATAWNTWMDALNDFDSVDDTDALLATLHNIPVRDALLAYVAHDPAMLMQLQGLLQDALNERDVVNADLVPAWTVLAACDFLDDSMLEAAAIVHRVLGCQEYSLARLLGNGLAMRAPASLLQRSIAHFTPQELLAS